MCYDCSPTKRSTILNCSLTLKFVFTIWKNAFGDGDRSILLCYDKFCSHVEKCVVVVVVVFTHFNDNFTHVIAEMITTISVLIQPQIYLCEWDFQVHYSRWKIITKRTTNNWRSVAGLRKYPLLLQYNQNKIT